MQRFGEVIEELLVEQSARVPIGWLRRRLRLAGVAIARRLGLPRGLVE